MSLIKIYPLKRGGEASAFAGFFRLPASTGALASSLRGAADAAELFSSNDLPCRASGWSLHQQQWQFRSTIEPSEMCGEEELRTYMGAHKRKRALKGLLDREPQTILNRRRARKALVIFGHVLGTGYSLFSTIQAWRDQVCFPDNSVLHLTCPRARET